MTTLHNTTSSSAHQPAYTFCDGFEFSNNRISSNTSLYPFDFEQARRLRASTQKIIDEHRQFMQRLQALHSEKFTGRGQAPEHSTASHAITNEYDGEHRARVTGLESAVELEHRAAALKLRELFNKSSAEAVLLQEEYGGDKGKYEKFLQTILGSAKKVTAEYNNVTRMGTSTNASASRFVDSEDRKCRIENLYRIFEEESVRDSLVICLWADAWFALVDAIADMREVW
ncbi:hypothetical protein BJ508DRAFT_329566 [Ascobolus immersus RN42]|uniref:Uncharacterized protein n=1 Tax=Ascobolus immersus RN42 TaxID=1160509 RepID=A0A3N4HWL0_ASCIM|nr:hypothetical protein BJ508DRAFT_329566 [Ascobolus immersus RN42]